MDRNVCSCIGPSLVVLQFPVVEGKVELCAVFFCLHKCFIY
jgi:hypothetical protein